MSEEKEATFRLQILPTLNDQFHRLQLSLDSTSPLDQLYIVEHNEVREHVVTMDVLVICKKGDEWVLIYFTRCVWNMNLSQIPICLEYFMWFSFLVFLFRAGRLEEVHATLVKKAWLWEKKKV